MSVLIFGFYGEGGADYAFIRRIVERTIIGMIPHVDVFSMAIEGVNAGTQPERILEIGERASGYNFVVFHLDADAPTTQLAYEQRFMPGYEQLQHVQEDTVNRHVVPVIPVRMSEAWMLVDFEAFQHVVGTKKSGSDLGFPPRSHQVEAIGNPKGVFEEALRNARPGRRRTIAPDEIYTPLADQLRLERLRSVPAYQEFQSNLEEILIDLHFIDRLD